MEIVRHAGMRERRKTTSRLLIIDFAGIFIVTTHADDFMKKRTISQVTLKDVAAAAGVSVMSVSNVVNERWDLVSERTRIVIEEEIKRLKYQPQMAGRSLRTGRSNTVGLISLQGTNDSIRFNRRGQASVAGFLEATAGHGYNIVHIFRSHCLIETAVSSLSQRLDGAAVLIDESVEIRKKDIAVLASLSIPIVELQGLRLLELADCCSIHEKSEAQMNSLAAYLVKARPGRVYHVRSREENGRASRRYKLLKAHPSLRHFQFLDALALDEFLTSQAQLGAGVPISAVFVSSDIEYADIIHACAMADRFDIIEKVICLDAEVSNGKPSSRMDIPGFHSVSFRVGTVAGTSLLGRLSSTAFTYKDIAVDCGLILPEPGHLEDRRGLRLM